MNQTNEKLTDINKIAIKGFKSLLRRTKYSMAAIGLIAHSCTMQFIYKSPSLEERISYMKSDVLSLLFGFLVCATLIETGMYFINKTLERYK